MWPVSVNHLKAPILELDTCFQDSLGVHQGGLLETFVASEEDIRNLFQSVEGGTAAMCGSRVTMAWRLSLITLSERRDLDVHQYVIVL